MIGFRQNVEYNPSFVRDSKHFCSLVNVSEPRAVATGSFFICHFPFTIRHFKSVRLSLCARVNWHIDVYGSGIQQWQMRNAKWKMKNNPVATTHASEI
jgi:hypothetical protein